MTMLGPASPLLRVLKFVAHTGTVVQSDLLYSDNPNLKLAMRSGVATNLAIW